MANKLEVDHLVLVAKAIADYLQFKGDTWQAIAAQLALEKGWAWWANEGGNWNVANVTNGGVTNGFADYASLVAGEQGYVNTMENGLYQKVLEAGRSGDLPATLEALAASPWCDPPYGAVLNSVFDTFHRLYLTFEATAKEPAKVETPPTGEEWVTVTVNPPFNTLWGIAETKLGSGLLFPTLLKLNPGIQH